MGKMKNLKNLFKEVKCTHKLGIKFSANRSSKVLNKIFKKKAKSKLSARMR